MSTSNTTADWIADAIAELPPIATLAEARRVIRCSDRQARRMIATGRLRAIRAVESGSSRVLVPRTEVERYLRSLAVTP